MKVLNRKEIEEKLQNVGDYVKMDFLQNCLRQQLDFDTRKFVLIKLAGAYELRRMFLAAAKLMKDAADINTTYQGKIDDFVKSGELFIKAGKYVRAEESFSRAFASANSAQTDQIKMSRRELYKSQARLYLNKDRRHGAMLTYEKLLTLGLDIEERRKVEDALLDLYDKLGKIKEYYSLRRSMGKLD